MKTRNLLAVLLGIGCGSPALAQTTPPATKAIGTGLPSAPPPGAVPQSATAPTSPTGPTNTLYSNGAPPRNLNGGTQRLDQPVDSRTIPATAGSQPTKVLRRGRSSAKSARP